MKKLIVISVFCSLSSVAGFPQSFVEIRGADSKYRYVDWMRIFSNNAAIDAFYIGVPGNNEFNVGAGYQFKLSASTSLTPLIYAVAAKEDDERGMKLALLLLSEKEGWKASMYLAHFSRFSGQVPNYLVLDTFDFTRTIYKKVDAGVSAGFFRQAGIWNPLAGPAVKLNDKYGSWTVSYRFGPNDELRFGRFIALP